MIDKVALCYGQMNEPPGARLRVGLSGLTMAEYFRDQGQDVLLFIDNIFRFVQAGSEVSALLGPDAERGRLPADARHRDGAAAGADHLDQQGLGHLGAGDLRPRRRPHRPGAREHLRPPRLDDGALARARRAGDLPRRRPARLDLARARPRHRLRRALRHRHARAGDPAALQGPAGHHRDPRHRGALRRGPADGRPRPQGAALPLAALPRRRGLHRHARASTSSSRTRSAASSRSSRAATTTSPSRPSTWSARSRARSSAASSWRRRSARGSGKPFDVSLVTPDGPAFEGHGGDDHRARADRRDRRARPPRAAHRDAAGPARPASTPAAAPRCSSSRPARASSRSSHDRAIALVDDAVEASEIDDARARAQLEAAQAELEAIDARRLDRRPLAGRAADPPRREPASRLGTEPPASPVRATGALQ